MPKSPIRTTSTHTALLLQNAGYHLSRTGRRATCPKCSTGRTDFVVSVNLDKGLYNCFRCNRGGKIANLGPAFTFGRQTVRIRCADIKKREFQQWLDSRMKEMGDKERRLARRAALAGQVLQNRVAWPVDPMAWAVLAGWYDSQRQFEAFWQGASDKCGRLALYRQWRRGTRG